MGDPEKHYQLRKQRKQNATNPVVSFRCPSISFKKRLKAEAKKEGVSLQEYLLIAVSRHVANSAPAPATKRKWKKTPNPLDEWIEDQDKKVDTLNAELSQALTDLDL